MILFDNMYYLLYGYFKRTNSGKWGYKGTALSIASLNVAFSFLLLIGIIKIVYYFTLIELSSSVLPQQKNEFWLDNDIITFVIATVIFILMEIRYNYIMTYDKINEIKNHMKYKKRKILDDLTILYLIIIPFLMYFVGDFTNNLFNI